MEDWRLYRTFGADPAFNMGLDEALLTDPDSPPTLRLYTWVPDTLSLGYFQRFEDVPGVAAAGAVVRRITGGGAIHHVHELTFAFTGPATTRVHAGTVIDGYARVHRAIARALERVGVEAGLRGDRAVRSDREGTGMCFHASTALDLVWGGRKGVGSAQRRSKGRVLHHGSIKLGSSPLEDGVARVAGLAPERFAPLLVETLTESLGLALHPGEPEYSEITEARVRGARYLEDAFLRRR